MTGRAGRFSLRWLSGEPSLESKEMLSRRFGKKQWQLVWQKIQSSGLRVRRNRAAFGERISPEVPAKDGPNPPPESAPKPPPPVRTLPARTRWLVIAGILFMLAFGSVLAFFLFHRATKLERGGVVLNAIPGKTNVLLDGALHPLRQSRPLSRRPAQRKALRRHRRLLLR